MTSVSDSVSDSVYRAGLATRTDGRTDERTESDPHLTTCLAVSYARARVRPTTSYLTPNAERTSA
jgi:hypothetical protein